ncbi:MAG: SDR family NAD(P)-dependent oxidoreductase [Vicinamibacterales bacterium]
MAGAATVAVVTGATRGVGRGVASELARQGARVFVTGRSAPDGESLGERITGMRCDHRDDAQVDAAFAGIRKDAGADTMFGAGVRAHYRASQLAAPGMVARKRGLIVNISFWAAQKYIGNVAYGVSKAATDKLTADMTKELAPHGVAVVSLNPGMVPTPTACGTRARSWSPRQSRGTTASPTLMARPLGH